MNPHESQPPPIESEVHELDASQVEEVLRALSSALRSYRLYEGSNPILDRFVATLRQRIEALWERTDSLVLEIEEDHILWHSQEVYPKGESNTELSFLFYKDGIREITILPGFEEGDEALTLLAILARIPAVRQDEDDLITLLWQEDFAHFRYETVEAAGERIDLPSPVAAKEMKPIDSQRVRAEEAIPLSITPDDFQEALYFLDDSELRTLRDEVERETRRDLWRDVLNALLDRLEDGAPARQQRVIGILGELLPSALASAQFERSAALLDDLVSLAGRSGVLAPPALREVRRVFDQLGQPDTVMQLADILEEMPSRLSEDAVLRLLGYFPPGSIASLMRAAERVEQAGVRHAFEVCIQRLAEKNREEVVRLLSSDEPPVLAGALRWIGRLGIGSAVSEVSRFLHHSDAEVRIAAVEALVSVRAAAAAMDIVPLLDDSNRDVRVAAARALGALSFTAARGALESVLASKRIREADRLEKLAFFEAFGRLAGTEGVPVLDKILNSRSWLGRAESPEIRACAALGLAKIRHPSAREALNAASNETDPVVRTAVTRALRGEAT